MGELDKETEASDGSLDLEREKDDFGGSEKRKYTETESVKIAKFGRTLSKHAKTESSSMEWGAKEEQEEQQGGQKQVGYAQISILYARTRTLLLYDPDDYNYPDDPFLEEVERQKINQTKLSHDNDDDDEDLWSSEDDEEEEEEEIQVDEKDEEKDVDDVDTEEEEETEKDEEKETEKDEEKDKDADETKENEDEGKYDICLYGDSPCRSCTESERARVAEDKAKKEFCELVLKRLDIKNGSTAPQVYRRLKEANMTSTVRKFEALRIINTAIRYYSKDKSSRLSESVKRLMYLVPCITVDRTRMGWDYFVESCNKFGIRNAEDVGHCLFDVFFAVERVFHPLIRKKNIKEIVWISRRNAKLTRREFIQKCMDNPYPFDWAALREERISQEALQDAFKTVKLHQNFDRHLASCSFLNGKSKIEELMTSENVVTDTFKKLDASLIKASLRWRVRLLRKISEYKRYIAWLTPIVELKAKKGHTVLDGVLEAVREVRPDFPNLSEECILDQKHDEFSSFCELLTEIKRYLNCPVSHRYLIEGILVYLNACSDLGKTMKSTEKMKVLAEFQSCCRYGLERLDKVWGSRHYEHPAYRVLFDP